MARQETLEPIAKAAKAIPTRPNRATVRRWLDRHPDLGLRIGGRAFLWRDCRQAIANGTPLDEAAAIGRRIRVGRA